MHFEKEISSLKTAVLINAVSKYFKVLINLFFTAVLARILTPEDYGVVAVVTVFTTFFSIFSDMGLSTAVIQNKDLGKDDVNSIYSFSVYMGIILCILFAAFSYPLSIFYKDTVYVSLVCILSISLLFNTMNMIPSALLMKNKLFLVSALRTIVQAAAGGIVSTIMALMGYKYYAIVISSVFQAVLAYLWNMRHSGLRFCRKVNISSIKKVLGFSVFQFAFSIVNYFSRNLDNLLVGRLIGKVMLGYYDKAYQLMQYPISNLTHVITPVLHPILSEYQKDKEYIYFQYTKVVRFLAAVGMFVSVCCYLSSEELVYIFFGKNWETSVPCFTWMSISICAQMISSSTGSIFQSLNETKKMFYIGSFNAVLNVIAIIFGVLTGNVIKLSMCVGICYIFHFFTTYYVLIRFVFELSFLKFLIGLWREALLGILLMTAALFYSFSIQNIILGFVIKAVYLGSVYIIGLFLTGEYRLLLYAVGTLSKQRDTRSEP